MSRLLPLIGAVLSAAWDTFFLAAPYVLFGLLVAALLQVLISQRQLARWMGGGGLAAAARAALLGLPLPICSCGIVPVAISLRKKGASRPALLSFLITTPESSADAVILTWGLMGPLMTLARLVTALISALVAAVLAIATDDRRGAGDEGGIRRVGGVGAASAATAAGTVENAPNPASPGPAAPPAGDEDANYLGFRGLGRAVAAALLRLWSPPPRAADPRAATAAAPAATATAGAAASAVTDGAAPPAAESSIATNASGDAAPLLAAPPASALPGTGTAAAVPAVTGVAAPPAADSTTAITASGATAPLTQILRAAGRHAFVELVDDIVFWLVVGVLAAGIIAALVPPELVAAAGGGGLRSMLILMVVAIPIYVCASASTPIAAALVAKGVSPGAALVFLLTGPATNTATVSLLARNFGGRFLRIYLGSVLATALLCGLALDAVLAATGWQITGRLASEAEGIPAFFELLCALTLGALVVWRLWAGAARQGVRELAANLRGFGRWLARTAGPAWLPWRARWLPRAALAAAALAYLASGLAIVPAGAIGYELLGGRLVRPPLAPGLHWLPPRPFARIAIWRLQYPRRADVGFRTDLTLLAKRQELMRQADPAQWHSPVAAMNTDSREASYLAGDENLLEMSFTVRYGLADPYSFLYRLDREHDLVGLCAQAVARELVAASTLDELLTAGRAGLETRLAGELQRRLDRLGAGVRVASVHIVDLHPPQDAVFAFRDVSSAREDRDRRIQTALAEGEKEVPTARGNAALGVGEAQAKADGARAVATGRAEGFVARAAAFAGHRDILRDLLWLETEEKVLPGRRKFILPKGAAGGRVVLWPDKPVAQPIPPPTDGE